MTDIQDPPPLSALDAQGQPATISYDLAQPNRIRGRHYLSLGLNLADFIGVSNGDPAGGVAQPALTTAKGVEPRSIVNGLPVTSGDSAASGPASDDPPDPRAGITVPAAIVLGTPDADPVVLVSPFPLSADLAALTWQQVRAIQAAGRAVILYRSISGELHFRVATAPPPLQVPEPTSSAVPALAPRLWKAGDPPDNRGGDGPRVPAPYVTVLILSPDRRSPVISGPAGGVLVAVTGRCGGRVTGASVFVTVGDAKETAVTVAADGRWALVVEFSIAGQVTVQVRVTNTVGDLVLTDSDTVTLDVHLDLPQSPPVAPTITITAPGRDHDVVAPQGAAIVPVAGTVDVNGASAVTQVQVAVDGGDPLQVDVTPVDGLLTWSTDMLLAVGTHEITVRAANADSVPAPAAVSTVTIVLSPAVHRVSRQLFLAETLTISSYLTGIGAGRLVKVFSLLAGEEATFKVQTYSKDSTSTKSTSSVLDSSSTEAATDFEQTMADEQGSKSDTSSALDLSLSTSISAQWGWGEAAVKGGVDSKSNAALEQTTKNARTALAKQAEKAASNRSITVNAENSTTGEHGNQDDSTRTLKNINVGRVLNYVFRQVTQEVLTTVSLTDVVLVERIVDVPLRDDGTLERDAQQHLVTTTTVTEYSISALQQYADDNLQEELRVSFVANIRSMLGSIPDHAGRLTSMIEEFVPTDAAGPRPDLAYVRVSPDLHGSITTPAGGTVTVPGIVLSVDSFSMPSDAVVVDAVLGGGNALDPYSRGLQEVTISEREAAVARELLAQEIIRDNKTDSAALWSKVYPPAVVPATTTATA